MNNNNIDQTRRSERISFGIIVAAMIFLLVYCVISANDFSADSYGYHEVSKTIFKDFGRINTIRQYSVQTEYNISYPYLFPALIAIVNAIFHMGIFGGVFVNVIVSAVTSYVIWAISKKHFGTVIPAAVTSVLLLCNFYYLDEVKSARAVPTSLLCSLVIMYFLLKLPNDAKWSDILFAGIFAGSAVVISFDTVIVVFCAFVSVIIFSKGKNRLIYPLIYLGGMLVFTLPWIIYSITRFNTFWITAGPGVEWLVDSSRATRYYSPGYEPATLFNSPSKYFSALFGAKFKSVAKAFIKCTLCTGALFYVIWLIVNTLRSKKIMKKTPNTSESDKLKTAFAVVAVTYIIRTARYIMVGYGAGRFQIETWLMVVFFLTAFISRKLQYTSLTDKIATSALTIVMTVLVMVQVGFAPIWRNVPVLGRFVPKFELDVVEEETGEVVRDYKNIEIAVTEDKKDPRVLFFGSCPQEFGDMTGISTFVAPAVEPDDRGALVGIIDSYIKPDYIVVGMDSVYLSDEDTEKLVERYGLITVSAEENMIYKVMDDSHFKK
ncbi:MAG: glycosyltransferase family 39 protein [Clostridia bacterium]|nr:glycosyltransferase family 39 protein [Clostridia bacterium]